MPSRSLQSQPSYYSLLGIGRDATAAEIEAACDAAVRQLRTPRWKRARGWVLCLATEAMVERARKTLLDPQARRHYDDSLSFDRYFCLPPG